MEGVREGRGEGWGGGVPLGGKGRMAATAKVPAGTQYKGLRPRTGRRVAQWDAHSARILSRRVTRRGHNTNRPAAPRLQRPPARSTELDAACTSVAEVSCSTLWIGLHASQESERPAYSVLGACFDAVSTLHQHGSNWGGAATACRISRPRPMARRHYLDQAFVLWPGCPVRSYKGCTASGVRAGKQLLVLGLYSDRHRYLDRLSRPPDRCGTLRRSAIPQLLEQDSQRVGISRRLILLVCLGAGQYNTC